MPSRKRTAVWIEVITDVADGGRILAAPHRAGSPARRVPGRAAMGPEIRRLAVPTIGRVGAVVVRAAAGPRVGLKVARDIPWRTRHGTSAAADVDTSLGQGNNRLRSSCVYVGSRALLGSRDGVTAATACVARDSGG